VNLTTFTEKPCEGKPLIPKKQNPRQKPGDKNPPLTKNTIARSKRFKPTEPLRKQSFSENPQRSVISHEGKQAVIRKHVELRVLKALYQAFRQSTS